MDNYLITDFDNAPDNEIILNGYIKVKGAVNVSAEKDSDNRITIKGILASAYYEGDIQTIETRRYFIQNIDVYKEDYCTDEETIVYSFTAESITVKYQISPDDYKIINK